MIKVLADENIAGLEDYFAPHPNVKLITDTGRTLGEAALIHRPNALFVRSVTTIDDKLPYLPAFVASATLGLDHVDLAFMKAKGVGFAWAEGSSKHSVAQYVITAILHLRPSAIATPLKLGIIGLGNIGGTLTNYAHRLGWQVLGYDPFLPTSVINHHDIDALLDADVISLHTPLTYKGAHPTYHLLNQDYLQKLCKNTLIINAARGRIIDEQALMEFLESGGQAVLDVFENEPTPSRKLIDRLALATPHIAGYSLEGKLKGTDMIYQAFCRYFNLPILSTWQDFIKPSPYHFSELIRHFSLAQLSEFYDIKSDDTALRQRLGTDSIRADDFDALRKHYHLRREWHF